MEMLRILIIALIFALVGISGCTLRSSDKVERTYPEAFDFELVTITQLRNEIPTPDSVNIEVYITRIYECPKNASCIVPDHIIVSETLPAEDSLYIAAVKPSQFQKEELYRISVRVSKRESKEHRDVRILGYSLL